MTFQRASDYCRDIHGTSLASIHSIQQNEEASLLCDDIGFIGDPILCWIGLNTTYNNWTRWTDQTIIDYISMEIHTENGGNCVGITTDTAWRYEECDWPCYPLCNAYTKTNPPTINPTRPSLMPTSYPTSITLNPTQSPSTDPTNLSKPPSVSPTTATQSPTYSPSYDPTTPTQSPTHSSKVSCGNNEWCYFVDITPMIGSTVSKTLYIANDHEDEDTYFHVQFNIIHDDCSDPRLSLRFEEIDFLTDDEYLDVFDNQRKLIRRCTGETNANCGEWILCLDEHSIVNGSIMANDTYNISIFQPHTLNSLCEPLHSYSINLELTILCTNPYPTTSPSTHPTADPTAFPIDYMYSDGVWCGDNIECHYVDIFPIPGVETSKTIEIFNQGQVYPDIPGAVTSWKVMAEYLNIALVARNHDCFNPKSSIKYDSMPHNIYSPDSFLEDHFDVMDSQYNLLRKCVTDESSCMRWPTCFVNQPLPVDGDLIMEGDSYGIHIYQPSQWYDLDSDGPCEWKWIHCPNNGSDWKDWTANFKCPPNARVQNSYTEMCWLDGLHLWLTITCSAHPEPQTFTNHTDPNETRRIAKGIELRYPI